MITVQQIRIFKKYKGDLYARVGSFKEKSMVDDEVWGRIVGFIQDIEMKHKGLTSEQFNQNLQQQLDEQLFSTKALEEMKTLIEK